MIRRLGLLTVEFDVQDSNDLGDGKTEHDIYHPSTIESPTHDQTSQDGQDGVVIQPGEWNSPD